MTQKKVFRRIALFVSLLVMLTSTVNSTFGFIVTKTDNLINTFVPVASDPDSISLILTVNKTIRNTGDAAIGPAGFEFVLENTDTGETQFAVSNTAGKAHYVLTYTSADIGNTYVYHLYETNRGDAGISYDDRVYEISVSVALSEDNELLAGVRIDGQVCEDLVVEFVNTYHSIIPDSDPTGDRVHILFWIAMMTASGAICILFVLADNKRRLK